MSIGKQRPLIDRLRDPECYSIDVGSTGVETIFDDWEALDDAAAEITRLRAEVERLTLSRDQIIEQCAEVCDKARDAAMLAQMQLGKHEVVAIACTKSMISALSNCAAAIRALKEGER